MNIFFILILSLLFTSCAVVDQGNEDAEYEVGPRWIDMTDILEFIQYSEINWQGKEEGLQYIEVLNHLGEPIYLEKYNIDGKSNILLWYLYKSKYYPVIKNEQVYSSANSYNLPQPVKTSKQIKPEKLANYELWESSEKWLLIVLNEDYHEIIFTSRSEQEPRFKRDMVFESLKFKNNLK